MRAISVFLVLSLFIATVSVPASAADPPAKTGYFFIHGYCSSSALWKTGNGAEVYDALTPHAATNYHPKTEATPAEMAAKAWRDLRAFYEKGDNGKPLKDVVIVGHSNGGILSALLATRAASTKDGPVVKRVVALDTPFWGYSGEVSPCSKPWNDYLWRYLAQDKNGNAPEWIRKAVTNYPASIEMVRAAYLWCNPHGQTCEGNWAVGKDAAPWKGAIALTFAHSKSSADMRGAAKSACNAGVRAVEVSYLSSSTTKATYHSSGTKLHAPYIVQLATKGPSGLTAARSGDHVVSPCP